MQLDLATPKTNAYGEVYFESINQNTFSDRASVGVFDNILKETVQKTDCVFIFIGSDSGLLAKYLAKQTLPKSSHYLIIDDQSVYDAVSIDDAQMAAYAEARVHLHNEQFDMKDIAFDYENYLNRQAVVLVKSIAVLDAPADSFYGQFWQHYYQVYNQFMTSELVALNARPFIDAQIANLAENQIPMKDLALTLDGTTALILGGGPTLDDAIDWIKTNQEKLVIFAAGRIARRCIKEGISPDFFVSVDPHDVSFDNSKGIFAFQEEAILLHSHHVCPKIIGQWAGKRCFTGPRLAWKSDFSIENIDAPGPNVINTALHLAVELGCNRFIFSGVDMCFPGGKAFESGSDEAKVGGRFIFKDVHQVMNNAGEISETQPRYATGRDMLEKQVAHYQAQKPELEFINTGRLSARVEGMAYVPAEQIALVDATAWDKLAQIHERLTLSKKQLKDHYQACLVELKRVNKRFYDMQKVCKDVVAQVPKLYNKHGEQDAKVVKRVLKAKAQVEKMIADDGDMLITYNTRFFEKSFAYVEDESAMTSEEVCEQLTGYFSGVQKTADKLIEQIRRSQNRVQLKQDSLKTDSNLAGLVEKWQKIGEHGRVHQWLNDHLTRTLTVEEQALVDQEIAAFQAELQSTQTAHVASLKQRGANLTSILQRVKQALDTQQISAIKDIETHVESALSGESQKSFLHYLHGIGAEMREEVDLAINEYQQVKHPRLKHLSLTRALNLSLKHPMPENSMALFEQLCQISMEYMLSYSDFMDLIGQEVFAIDLLIMYVQNHTENLSAHNKLARKLMAAERFEEADYVLKMVLEKDADNLEAQTLMTKLAQP